MIFVPLAGRLEQRPPTINYTGLATPLRFDTIQRDINRVESVHDLEVGAIVMWQHQFDWLLKVAHISPQPKGGEHFVIRDQGNWSRHAGAEPSSIFGVEVEIAND